MKTPVAAVGIMVAAGCAMAQVGTGRIWFEASEDEGSTWISNYLLTSNLQPSVLVRIRATWSADAGMYAMAGTQFDVTISDAAADSVTEAERPWPMWAGASQTIVATHLGSTIKIDDSRDTLAPGAGNRGVFPGQLPQMFTWTNFSSANPITLFQFRLNFGDRTVRTLDSLYVAPTGGDTISRYMRVFTSDSGASNLPQTTTGGIIIDNFTPSPGGAACLAIASALGSVRRRRPTAN